MFLDFKLNSLWFLMRASFWCKRCPLHYSLLEFCKWFMCLSVESTFVVNQQHLGVLTLPFHVWKVVLIFCVTVKIKYCHQPEVVCLGPKVTGYNLFIQRERVVSIVYTLELKSKGVTKSIKISNLFNFFRRLH